MCLGGRGLGRGDALSCCTCGLGVRGAHALQGHEYSQAASTLPDSLWKKLKLLPGPPRLRPEGSGAQ